MNHSHTSSPASPRDADLSGQQFPSGETVHSNGMLFAGTARSDITTTDSATRVRDRLFAKVIAFHDAVTTLVIVAMDAVAIGGICDITDEFLPALRARIKNALNIPGRCVLVNASHTHPPGRILCDHDQLLERTFDAVRRAVANMVPVKVGVGVGHESRITMNRTLRLKDGSHWSIRHTNPSPADELVEALGPVDPQIGVIRIDRVDGPPLAVIYNFACHLLFGDPAGSVTANFTGIASNVIEKTLGHGAMALFLQGAAGDVIDVQFKDFQRLRNVEPLGHTLAQSTLDTVRTIKCAGARIDVTSQTVALPRRTDINDRIAALKHKQAQLLASLRFNSLNFKSFLPLYMKYATGDNQPSDHAAVYLHARQTGSTDLADMDAMNRRTIGKYLHNITAMENLTRIQDEIATFKRHRTINDASGQTTVAAELQGIRIGDCVLLASPLEVLTEVGLRIKAQSPHEHTFVVGFSNGYLHYGPPADDYDKGGYEVTECMLAPQWQQVFEHAAQEILRKL